MGPGFVGTLSDEVAAEAQAAEEKAKAEKAKADKEKADKEKAEKEEGKQPKEKRPFITAFNKAVSMKEAYQKAELKAKHLVDSFALAEYAKEKRAYGEELEAAQKALVVAKDADPFFGMFILKEQADVKAAWPNEDALETLCDRFTNNLALPVKELSRCNKEVLTVVRARVTLAKAATKAGPKKAAAKKAATA